MIAWYLQWYQTVPMLMAKDCRIHGRWQWAPIPTTYLMAMARDMKPKIYAPDFAVNLLTWTWRGWSIEAHIHKTTAAMHESIKTVWNVRCSQGIEGYAAGQMHKLGCHGKNMGQCVQTWCHYAHSFTWENANADEMDACDICIMHPIM